MATTDTAQEKLRQPQENDALAFKAPDLKVKYGNHHMQYVDIRLPDRKTFGQGSYPTIIVIHGGCWVRPYASAKNSAALADALRDAGYLTINAEYRTIDEEGGGWPGTLLDIATITDNLTSWTEIAPIDPTRVATIGHSAGGHLALWALARQKLNNSSPLFKDSPFIPRGAISLGGPGDLLNAREDWTKGCEIDSITALLQGPEMRALNAASASPAELLPFDGKQYLITGELDHVTPVPVSNAYEARATASGTDITHIVIPKTGHHEYLHPNDTANWAAITKALEDIFKD